MSIDTIKSRGHWTIIIRPIDFRERRVDRIAELERILHESVVAIRGWDFPHIDYNNPIQRDADYIQQNFEWHIYKEFWRFYLSGQFIFMDSFRAEWRDQQPDEFPRLANNRDPLLYVGDVISKWTELLIFSTKLMSRLHSKEVDLSVSLHGLNGRQLYYPPINRIPFVHPKICTAPSYEKRLRLDTSLLSSEFKNMALTESRDIFNLFGWDPSIDILNGFQSEAFGEKI